VAATDIARSDRAPIDIAVHRDLADRVYRGIATAAAITTFVLMALIGGFLLIRGWDALRVAGWGFFTEQAWEPDAGRFGIGSMLPYTVVIAAIALLIAVPVSIGSSLFVTEYAPRGLRRPLTTLIDVLAAVPSLIYGLWGLFFLQPKMLPLSRWLADKLGFLPIFHVDGGGPKPLSLFAGSPFIAGVVVSLMVIPICTAVMREVFSQTPSGEKEGALALGGTRWGVIRDVVLPFGRTGIIGGSMLGLGRALGETIAVALLISVAFDWKVNVVEQGGNSIAAHIALRFSESTSFGISALMAAGLVLFVITLIVNAFASVVVARSRSGGATEI
jgi:phosphate transport system permease protein